MEEGTYFKRLKWYVNDARSWIEKYINGSKWILNNLDEKIPGIYKIEVNGQIAYIGQAGTVPNRLVEHAYTFAKHTEFYWGLYPKQIEDGTVKITMEYIEIGIPEENKRKDEERQYIGRYGSLLQRHKRKDGKPSDICTDDKGKRVEYMQSALKLN